MPCGPSLAFRALLVTCGGAPPQVPADAEASEVVDSTLAEPIAAAAALGLAPHDPLDVGSESEVPDFAQGWHAAMRFAVWYFADLCRSALQRAAAPEICLHMRVRRDPNTSYPLMPGWMQRNRSVLTAINTAINMMKRLLHQVLREHDRGVWHLRFRWLWQSRHAQAGSRIARWWACDITTSRMVLGTHEAWWCQRSRLTSLDMPLHWHWADERAYSIDWQV